MRQFFTYAGKPSTDFGIYLATADLYKVPARSYEKISIPGRNGDLTVDLGNYANVKRAYTVYTRDASQLRNFQSWILSQDGYQRLEDTYEPEHFSLATVDSIDVDSIGTQTGSLSISFDCKPQRYLKMGEQPIELRNSGTLMNPTNFTALPLIRVYGTGDIAVGNATVTIGSNPDYIDLDSELMDAYCGDINCNGLISLADGAYPELVAGGTTVTLGAGITKVVITPRWWVL